MSDKVDPVHSPQSTDGWDPMRKRRYIASRRELYPYEVHTTTGLGAAKRARPQNFDQAHGLPYGHFVRTPFRHEDLVVWQFAQAEGAEKFKRDFAELLKPAFKPET